MPTLCFKDSTWSCDFSFSIELVNEHSMYIKGKEIPVQNDSFLGIV